MQEAKPVGTGSFAATTFSLLRIRQYNGPLSIIININLLLVILYYEGLSSITHRYQPSVLTIRNRSRALLAIVPAVVLQGSFPTWIAP